MNDIDKRIEIMNFLIDESKKCNLATKLLTFHVLVTMHVFELVSIKDNLKEFESSGGESFDLKQVLIKVIKPILNIE